MNMKKSTYLLRVATDEPPMFFKICSRVRADALRHTIVTDRRGTAPSRNLRISNFWNVGRKLTWYEKLFSSLIDMWNI